MTTAKCLLLMLIIMVMPAKILASLREVREVHYQMGTFLELTLWHAEAEKARQLIRAAVQEVHRLEEILSHYDPDSALSKFNMQAGTGPRSVPAELFDLLVKARALSEKTDGLFDVTIGGLMNLWSEAARADRLPDRTQLKALLAMLGYRNLVLYENKKAEIKQPGIKIDFGGIGKGFAVDHVVEMLKARQISAALINFGGSSMAAIGAPPGQSGWQVVVQGAEGRLRGTVNLRDAALSTSGSMGRWWKIKGKRYGHLINPLSGYPVTERRVVTVVTGSATEAEALTKPLTLLGERGLQTTIEKFPHAAAVVIPETAPMSFARGFRAVASWKEIPQP